MNAGQSDNGFIDRLRTGDRQALKEIYLYHYSALFFLPTGWCKMRRMPMMSPRSVLSNYGAGMPDLKMLII